MAERRKVLFFAEAVTLAHISRPVVLAGGLDPERDEVVLATAPRYESLWRDRPFRVRPIDSITGEEFLDALTRGRPLYDEVTLRKYVEEDLQVIREVGPDVVVGDFRLSLSVSAGGSPLPGDHERVLEPVREAAVPASGTADGRMVGCPGRPRRLALARPFAFALHTRPLNRVRRDYELPMLGNDLRRVYTDADQTLYADVPELSPTFNLPGNHHFLGPVLWSPDVEPPEWWDEFGTDRPIVYVTMGSSGSVGLLSRVLDALAGLPVFVMAATLGRSLPGLVPANARTADYLPGREATAHARLVICNGGSPTTHQALAAGVPVLGIAGNMDQHLNMAGIVFRGAGEVVRSDRASVAAIRAAALRALDRPEFASAARELAEVFSGYDAPARFRAVVDRYPARGS